MKFLASLLTIITTIFFLACTNSSSDNKQESYIWKNIQIVGGGFVSGIIFHPKEKNLCYARTDMGGAYRLDKETRRWIPLMDWVSYKDRNLMGVESLALDPNNPNKLLLSCGTYTDSITPNGEVLVSNDRGNSFTRVKMPFKMGGNENGRGNGERMIVDPANGNIVYLGTRHNGLWRSNDGGFNWKQIKSFPIIHEEMPQDLSEQEKGMWGWALKGSGIVWVVADSSSATEKGCQTIYAAYSLKGCQNIFYTTNGGENWEPLPGQPTKLRPTHGILASNGMLYISYGDIPGPFFMYDGSVWKYDTKNKNWLEISPANPNPAINDKFGYAAVAVDVSNPNTVMVSTFHRPERFGGDDIFRSTDGGQTWTAIFANGTTFDYSKAPYVQYTPIHWMLDMEIDPFNSDHAIFVTGFGGFETFNLTNIDKEQKTDWSVYAEGIEETVPLSLCSPPEGAHLISGIGDYAGFVHWDLDKTKKEQYFSNPYFGNCDWVTYAELEPSVVVRVGISSRHIASSNIGYSTDFGRTWNNAKMPTPQSAHGTVAVAANGTTWVWTPEHQYPFVTNDKGETWQQITTLSYDIQVVADRVNPNKFYAIDLHKGLLYTSNNNAKTFSKQPLNLAKGLIPEKPAYKDQRGDIRGGQDRIYATPGYENDLWVAAFDGLYHKPTNDTSFTLMPAVTEMHGFGFGKAAPENNYPALYMIGKINGVHGIFRSNDIAQNWIRINDDQHQWGLLLHISGDLKKYGRVYIGTHGRGVIYGDIK